MHASVPYAHDGIALQHPATWEVSHDGPDLADGNQRQVHLSGPGEALILLSFEAIVPGLPGIEAHAAEQAQMRSDMLADSAQDMPSEQIEPGPTHTTPLSRRTPQGQEVRGQAQRMAYSARGVQRELHVHFFARDFGATRIILMGQALSDHAPPMQAALEQVVDTLHYRETS
ncbi:hypothetical protein HNP48_006807 [Acidovorax soli]|uniref:DUF1795 domain-containing protein n=1 Tax=Acidovorax soli TaxID=592050 RepID=A0A7X0PMD0_9BURK|nr:hypothetical protein [Acidovorax soli]MBB6564081.1 hypothetical protein [Acidovorax soli]